MCLRNELLLNEIAQIKAMYN